MGEIRIVGPGKTRGYPYPECKKKDSVHEARFRIEQNCGARRTRLKTGAPIIRPRGRF